MGRLIVAFMDPVTVLQMTTNPDVARVAHEVRKRLELLKAIPGQTASHANKG